MCIASDEMHQYLPDVRIRVFKRASLFSISFSVKIVIYGISPKKIEQFAVVQRGQKQVLLLSKSEME